MTLRDETTARLRTILVTHLTQRDVNDVASVASIDALVDEIAKTLGRSSDLAQYDYSFDVELSQARPRDVALELVFSSLPRVTHQFTELGFEHFKRKVEEASELRLTKVTRVPHHDPERVG